MNSEPEIAIAITKAGTSLWAWVMYAAFGIVGGVSRFFINVVIIQKEVPNLKRDIAINAFVAMPIAVIAGMAMESYFPAQEFMAFAAAYAFGNMANNIVRWLDSDGIDVLKRILAGRTNGR